MATHALPGMGYGLRYEHGIFRQTIRDGWQHEQPDHWLARPDPWEVVRFNEAVEVNLNCSFEIREGALRVVEGRPSTHWHPLRSAGRLWRKTINTLRLWAASTPDYFDFAQFSTGDFVGALAETHRRNRHPCCIPTTRPSPEKARFLQEYFLVACSLADLVRRFRGGTIGPRSDKAAIQLNDTHPTMAVPELMRLLLDEAKLGWDEAWSLTQRTLAYTNHTLLPEALEQWPVEWFEGLLPRQLEIIYEINRRFLDEVRARFPGDEARVSRASLIEERAPGRFAWRIWPSSDRTAPTASPRCIQRTDRRLVPDFATMFPERFNNKTNGVTPRRWLLLANPALAKAITEAIGDGWITDLAQLEKLKPLADDKSFRDAAGAKREAKTIC